MNLSDSRLRDLFSSVINPVLMLLVKEIAQHGEAGSVLFGLNGKTTV